MNTLTRTPFVCKACRHGLNAGAGERSVLARKGATHKYSTNATRERPLNIGIVGSGPAGYYTAYRLQRRLPNVQITMLEQLPVPYGLVRFGVAPDHPEVKKSAETLEDVAKSPNFRFFGNVPIGDGPGMLPLSSIAPHFDSLLFAYGASKDKRLDIPGEDLKGVVSARAFVGWYNGLPEYAGLNPDLQSSDTAVIIGQGNVALDVARFLLAPMSHLRETDASEAALEALDKSRIRNVKVVGRRGPLQAPYTIKELREIMTLPGVSFVPPPEPWEDLFGTSKPKLPRQLKRIAGLLSDGSKTAPEDAEKAWQLGFLRSPVEFLSQNGKDLHAVGFEQTEYEFDVAQQLKGNLEHDYNLLRALRVKSTGRKTLIQAGLAFRSVGYQSEALPGFDKLDIPFDAKKGIIPNDMHGRIVSPDLGPAGGLTAGHVPGMYCAGWVKRGPTGVIASTMDDAFNTAEIIARDWQDGVKFYADKEDKAGHDGVAAAIRERGIKAVSWSDWEKIDAAEREKGKAKGKVREKCRSEKEMMDIIG